jgi:hypothetical protein
MVPLWLAKVTMVVEIRVVKVVVVMVAVGSTKTVAMGAATWVKALVWFWIIDETLVY